MGFLTSPSILLVPSIVLAVTLDTSDQPQNGFSGAETEYRVKVYGEANERVTLRWRLDFNRAALAHGVTDMALDRAGSGESRFELRIPETKPGVVLKTNLHISIGKISATTPFWIFPKDAFLDRIEWLKSLELLLYDPSKTTKNALKGIPTTGVANLESLEEGILLVGDGVTLRTELFEALTVCASKGIPVICLAPNFKGLTLTGKIAGFRITSRSGFDDRLDRLPEPKSYALVARRNQLVLRTAEHDDLVQGSFIRIGIGESDTPILVLGENIVTHWDEHPAASFLLFALLEKLDSTREKGTTPDEDNR